MARRDLAAMMVPPGRTLAAAELPILREHRLSMWGYVVLLRLAEEPVRTQTALAQAIGADKTRIIADLDELQDRGLIQREPDAADRRVRLVSLTAEGARVRAAAQAAIQRREDRLLARLPAADRRAFLRSLEFLAGLDPEEITDPE
jgi:DNA-binding MarR family transcriptional regulator